MIELQDSVNDTCIGPLRMEFLYHLNNQDDSRKLDE